MTPGRFTRLLAPRAEDPGCEAVFEAMDRYVEAVLRGEDTGARFSGLLLHLSRCLACLEDTEGLRAALEDLEGDPSAK